MKKAILVILFCSIVLQSREYSSFIHSTNQHITQLLFYRPYTQTALLKDENAVNIDISESNVFQKSEKLNADFEITTLEVTYWYKYSKKLELSFNYPIYFLSKGFLDDGLDTIHHTLGITTTREHDGHTNNQFHFLSGNIDKSKSYWVSGNPQLELKYLLYNQNNLYLSNILGIKLPLGRKANGFSSGYVDFMGALALQKNYDNIIFLTNIALTYNGKNRVDETIESKRLRYFITVATAFNIYKNVDFLTSYLYESAPYSGEDVKYNSHSNFLQFGLRVWLKNKDYIDLYFNQNTIPRHNEADVTFGLSYFFKGF